MARNHGHNLFYFLTNLHITLKYGSHSIKSENMVDPLQFAAIAGCKTKPVEEFSVVLA
jgi:hypothetical protein